MSDNEIVCAKLAYCPSNKLLPKNRYCHCAIGREILRNKNGSFRCISEKKLRALRLKRLDLPSRYTGTYVLTITGSLIVRSAFAPRDPARRMTCSVGKAPSPRGKKPKKKRATDKAKRNILLLVKYPKLLVRLAELELRCGSTYFNMLNDCTYNKGIDWISCQKKIPFGKRVGSVTYNTAVFKGNSQ